MKATEKCHILRIEGAKTTSVSCHRERRSSQLQRQVWVGVAGRGWAWLPAGAALLHHLGAVEAGQLAESVVAVDDGPLHDLSVPDQEAGLWGTGGRVSPGPGPAAKTWNLCWLFRFRSEAISTNCGPNEGKP